MNEDRVPESVRPKPHGNSDDGTTTVANDEAKQSNTTAKPKQPYIKPAFRHEKVFVTTALSCGKLAGTCGSMTTKVS